MPHGFLEGDLLALALFEEARHLLDTLLQPGPLGGGLCRVEDDVDALFAFVVGVKPVLDGRGIDATTPHVAGALALERPADALDDVRDACAGALGHDHVGKPRPVQEADVPLGEVSAVEDEAHVLVAVARGLGEHELELAHVHHAAEVFLVEKGVAVVLVVGDREVEYGLAAVGLRVAELHDLDVARLAVLVRRVVGDVDASGVFPQPIPSAEEEGDVLVADGPEEVGYLRVGEPRHARSEHGVVVGVVGIVLGGVPLGDYGVCREVGHEARGFLAEDVREYLRDAARPDKPRKHEECARPECVAGLRTDFRTGDEVREAPGEVPVGDHEPVFREPADADTLRDGVLPFGQVFAPDLVIDVGLSAHVLPGYEPRGVGDGYKDVEFRHCFFNCLEEINTKNIARWRKLVNSENAEIFRIFRVCLKNYAGKNL